MGRLRSGEPRFLLRRRIYRRQSGNSGNFDTPCRVGELGLDGHASGFVRRVHPGVPGAVHRRKVGHVREENLHRQQVLPACSRLLQ